MTTPELDMLWESTDPHAALATRFGFAGTDAAERWLAGTLAERWGTRVLRCDRITMSAGNALAWLATEAGPRVAKWSVVGARHPRLAELARLTAWLRAQGRPVSAPLPALDGDLQIEHDGVSLSLQATVEGQLLDGDVPAHLRSAGTVLAELHLALAGYPDADRVAAATGGQRPAPLSERITGWLAAPERDLPSDGPVELLAELVAGAPTGPLPSQLIHNDFRSSNVLCGPDRITAVLDFEEARTDFRVADLAKAATFLGTRFRNWGPISPGSRALFLTAYQSVWPLSPDETRWLKPLILWNSLHAPHGGVERWTASALA